MVVLGTVKECEKPKVRNSNLTRTAVLLLFSFATVKSVLLLHN